MNSLLTRPRKTSSSDDNLIPLINIVFLLLIFFMVAGQMKAPLAADIKLPSANTELTAERDIRLELSSSGELFADGQAISTEQLPALLAGPGDTGIRVLLLADRDTTAATLDPLLSVLRTAGIVNIRLLTEPTGG